MPDMIVRLYDLPSLEAAHADAAALGIRIRPALASEKPRVVGWTRANFGFWAPEVEAAFARVPIACLLALREAEVLGFAAYDTAARNFFGPTGVLPEQRGRGIGRSLLVATLHAQRAQGYAYAIIGGVGPAEFYTKVVDARIIDGSTPGIYGDALPFVPES